MALASNQVKQYAHTLGFDACRILPVGEAPHAAFFDAWLDQGHAGEMEYLLKHRARRHSPALLADEKGAPFHSLIVLAVNYHQVELAPILRNDPSRGVIAAYAWGDDYHEIMRPLLYALDAFIRAQSGRTTLGKCLVDTGPVLERDWAHRAGIGFTGKNCCTIAPHQGSWLLLATLLVPEVLPYDPPIPETESIPVEAVLAGLPAAEEYGRWALPQHTVGQDEVRNVSFGTCGHCTRCLDACPTHAFVGPYHLDPLRCIAYWTIEARQAIPHELRPLMGNRIFGCDICQEVCPYNRTLMPRTPLLAGLHARDQRMAPPLLAGFHPDHPYWLNATAFNEAFRRSPIKRAKRHGMLRNVCVALGNWAAPAAIPALSLALRDEHSLPRQHAAWALGQVRVRHHDASATQALAEALDDETETDVLAEIHAALA